MTAEQLFQEHHRIAYHIVNKCGRWKPFVDREDMRQIALAAVWEAAQAFDPARGVKFVTFAGEYVKSAIRHEVERHLAKKRGGSGTGKEGRPTCRPAVRVSMVKRESGDPIDELTYHPDPTAAMDGEDMDAARQSLLDGVLGMMPRRLAEALRHQFLGGLDREQAALAAGFKNRRCFQVTLDNWRRNQSEFLNLLFERRFQCLA